MQPKFSYLSKLTVKVLELTGAGLASAIGGFFLAQIVTPLAATPPLAVQAAAANDAMMRMVRDERALLTDLMRELDAQRKPEQAAAPVPVPAPKPAKAAQAAPSRSLKPERTQAVELKPRIGEPLPIHPAVVVSEPLPKTMEFSAAARPIHVSAATGVDGGRSPLGMLKRIGAWFQPGNGAAPRPPMPVGKVQQSAL